MLTRSKGKNAFVLSRKWLSSHSQCGEAKICRAICEAELIFKHYQGVLSHRKIDFLLKLVDKVFMTAATVNALGGVCSLTFDSADSFWQHAQHKIGVPTVALRGVIEDGRFPEALQMLSNVLTKQTRSCQHDTQVSVEDAVGYPSRVDNANARQLKASNIPVFVQRAHHWSP